MKILSVQSLAILAVTGVMLHTVTASAEEKTTAGAGQIQQVGGSRGMEKSHRRSQLCKID